MKKLHFSLLPAAIAGLITLAASGTAPADNIYVSSNGDSSVEKIVDGSVTQFITDSPDIYGGTGLALDSAGNLYVANNGFPGEGFVSEFNDQGVFQKDVATGLSNPRGIVFDTSGDLFIADQSGGSIMEVTSGGTQQTLVGNLGYGMNGITIDSAGNLYVANGANNTVDKITLSGSTPQVTDLISTGLLDPQGITYITSGKYSGDLAIVDTDSDAVDIFNTAGDPVATPFIADPNPNDGPDYLTVDSQGDFFVTDNADQMVTEYGPDGAVLSVYKNDAGGNQAFSGPCGITAQLVVPEPSTYALLLAGAGALFFLARRKRATA
jgi:serine/threonine-protein kinase